MDDLDNRDKRILNTADDFISLLQKKNINSNKISKLLTKQSPIYHNIKKNSKIFLIYK